MKHSTRSRTVRVGAASALVGTLFLTAACTSTPEPAESDELSGTVTALINPEQNRGLSLFYDTFFEESGVEVDAEFTDSNSLVEQLRVQITSGTAPDLFRSSVGNLQVGVQTLGREGYLLDLSDQGWIDSIPESFMPLLEVDGGVYAYPTSAQGIVMFYNKAVFEELGIESPETWDDFIAVSQTVRDAGKVPVSLALGEPAYVQFIPYMLAASLVSSQTDDFYDAMDAGTTSFSESDEWREVFEKFFGLIDDGLTTPNPLGMPVDQSMQAVANGSAAMIPLVSANLPALAEYFPNGVDDVGVFALPASNDPSETWVPFSPDLLSVNADAANPNAALAFLDYIATPERATAYSEETGTVPALRGAEPVDSPVGQLLSVLNEDGRTAPFSVHRWPNGEVQLAFIQNAQLVVSGDLTIDGLLERMDDAYALGVR